MPFPVLKITSFIVSSFLFLALPWMSLSRKRHIGFWNGSVWRITIYIDTICKTFGILENFRHSMQRRWQSFIMPMDEISNISSDASKYYAILLCNKAFVILLSYMILIPIDVFYLPSKFTSGIFKQHVCTYES